MPLRRTSTHLLRLFITGALAALPLAATIAIFWWAASLLVRFLGPNSPVGGVLVAIGFGAGESEFIGYLIGVAIIAGAITLLGALVQTGLQRGLSRWFDSLLRRIPVVRTVYDLVHKLVGLFAQRDEDGLKSMSAVWCHFGGPGGAAALALLSSPQAVLLDGRRYLAVIVPTAPVPVGGGLLYVPEEWVQPADVGVEALTSIYVSLGVTSSQHLPPAPAVAAPVVQSASSSA